VKTSPADDTPVPDPRDAHDGELLDHVLGALERGEDVHWDRLCRENAQDAVALGALARALERYRGLVREVRVARGGPHLAPGDRLDDFEIVDLIAAGGMGEVYRAKQAALGGRLVALKVLRLERQSPVDEQRFRREAHFLSRLHHPNLAEVYGFGRCDDRPYLAMRLVHGISLARRLQERPGPVEAGLAVDWTADVASALAVLHGAGLVHRDVKPANVVLEGGRDGSAPLPELRARAVLVDFGLVRPLGSGKETRDALAPMTAEYAAPEQLLGGEVDARADVYSLGVVLHELLTGRGPVERGPAAARRFRPPRASGIDEDLRAIVARATAEHSDERYTDAQELLEDLEAWRNDRPVEARRRRRPVQWLRAAGRLGARRALVAGLVAAPVLVALELRGGGSDVDELAASLRDPDGALRIAAAHVREVGLDGDPTVLGVLLRPLRPEVAARDPSLAERSLGWLAAAVATRPDLDPRESPGSELVCAVARATLGARESTDLARLHALSILGSQGAPSDAVGIAAGVLQANEGSEELRLGCESLERIVRRSASLGTEAELLAALPCEALFARIRTLRESRSPRGGWGASAALQRLTIALHLARRRAQGRADARVALPSLWLEPAAIHWIGAGQFEPALELAAAGDSRAQEFLGVLEFAVVHRWQAQLAGRIAGFLDDRKWLVDARARLVEIGWEEDDAGRELDAAFEAARDELLRGGSAADVPDDGGEILARRTEEQPRAIVTQVLPEWLGFDEHYVGTWEFAQNDPPGLMGGALGIEGSGVALRREGSDPPSLLLADIGRSLVTLEFEADHLPDGGGYLRVLGQQSARRYLPYQGMVQLELDLDGRPVGTQILTHIGKGENEFELPSSWFRGGRQRLTLRLGEVSTTSYRLSRAVLAKHPRKP